MEYNEAIKKLERTHKKDSKFLPWKLATSGQSITNWITGASEPTLSNIRKIGLYLEEDIVIKYERNNGDSKE